jgi:hypothetical protein
MEHTAKINLKNFIFLMSFLVLPLFMMGQYSKTKISGAFAYKGNSTIKLTEDSSRQLLINELTKGAYVSTQNLSCRSDIGLYLFKVDYKGKINGNDIIYYGTLVDSTHESILINIKRTSGKYLRPSKNTQAKEHWYLFEYLSKGYRKECNDQSCRNEKFILEDQLINYKILIGVTIEKVKGISRNLTFIEGSSYDEAIRKGLVPPPEVLY